jgi:imidazolonepropionase-like amidohydrolase
LAVIAKPEEYYAWELAMRMRFLSVLAVLSTTALSVQSVQTTAGTQPAAPVVIHAGRLIDGVADAAATDQAIVVRDGRIVAVGPWASTSRPTEARVIDLSTATVLPGLIDNHTHLLLQGDITNQEYDAQLLEQSIPYRAILGARNAQRALVQGFTALRDLETEGAMYADVDIKRAIERGEIPGPRLWVATRAMAPTGAYGITTPNWEIRLPTGVQIVDGPDNIRQAVREQVKNGADLIKFYADRAYVVGSDGQLHSQANYTIEEAKALVSEARRLRRPVAAHAIGREGLEIAIEAGVTSVEHGHGITDELAGRLAKAGIYWCPTLFVGEYVAPGRTAAGAPIWTTLLQFHKRAFASALKAGVKISYGTDAGGFAWDLPMAADFPIMVRYGMTPMQAIKSATSVAAELLGQSENIGSLRTGRYADIIAVAGDPLRDVNELKKVTFVMKGGVVYKN